MDEKPNVGELFEVVSTEEGNVVRNLEIPKSFQKLQMSDFADIIEDKMMVCPQLFLMEQKISII